MKKIVSFEQIADSGFSGLDGTLLVAFPGARDVSKDGLVGLPFGTVTVDGIAWDWLLKNDHYVFIPAECSD